MSDQSVCFYDAIALLPAMRAYRKSFNSGGADVASESGMPPRLTGLPPSARYINLPPTFLLRVHMSLPLRQVVYVNKQHDLAGTGASGTVVLWNVTVEELQWSETQEQAVMRVSISCRQAPLRQGIHWPLVLARYRCKPSKLLKPGMFRGIKFKNCDGRCCSNPLMKTMKSLHRMRKKTAALFEWPSPL